MNPWVIIGIIAAFLGFGAACGLKGHSIGVDETTLTYETKLSKQADEANTVLLASKDEARDKVRAMVQRNSELEAENAALLTQVNGIRLANGRLIDATCGLYDRNGRPAAGGQGGSDGVSGSAAPAFSAQGRPAACNIPVQVLAAVREFGHEIADLLLGADQAAIYAGTGHGYAIAIGEFLGVPRSGH
jgi:hypothetical protein